MPSGRRYLYQISTRRTAFAKPYVWWVKEAARDRAHARSGRDVRRRARFPVVRRVAEREDAKRAGADARSTVVQLDRLEIVEDGALMLVAIEGSHFLWKMVRRIVGVLVEIGRGGLPVTAASDFLHQPSSAPARLTAPRIRFVSEPRVLRERTSRGIAARRHVRRARVSPRPKPRARKPEQPPRASNPLRASPARTACRGRAGRLGRSWRHQPECGWL